MKVEKLKTLTLIILVIIVALLIPYALNLKNSNEELVTLNESVNAELQTWIDKDGLNRARIEAIETKSTETFLAIKSQDSIIKELQNTVKEYGKYIKKQGSASIVETVTRVDTVFVSNNQLVDINTTNELTDSISNNWIKSTFGFKLSPGGDGKLKVDSTLFSLKVNNKYSLVIGREKTGIFGMGKGKPFAEIKNFNPYTKTEELRTYQVDGYDDKRFTVGPQIGVTWDGEFKPYIGIGLGYTLFKF